MPSGIGESFRLIEQDTVHDLSSLQRQLGALLDARPAGSNTLLGARGPLTLPTLMGVLALFESGISCMLIRDAACMPEGVTAPEEGQLRWIVNHGGSGDSALWMQTSGTSGKPKWVAQTPQRLLRRVQAGRSKATWLLTYEPASFAGIQVLLSSMVSGHTLVSAPPGASVATMADLAARYGVTHMSGTPTFWRAFMRVANAGEVRLEQITLGGEVADQATLDALRHQFPSAGIRHIYASTEAGVVFTVRDGKAGFPAQWLDQPPDNGLCLAESANGTLLIGARSQPMDQWLDSADVVVREGDRIQFRGRADAMVNIGGVKVFPEEVEAHLLKLGFLNDALVRAQANPITGSILTAEIVARPGAKDEAWVLSETRRHLQALPRQARPALLRLRDSIERGTSQKKVRH